jgi:hypothetical protein
LDKISEIEGPPLSIRRPVEQDLRRSKKGKKGKNLFAVFALFCLFCFLFSRDQESNDAASRFRKQL